MQLLSPTTHLFTGHERDAETGLDYMMARYYSAGLGRFLSVDPVGGGPPEPQSWNRYSYVGNNPLVQVDPDGLIDIRTDDEKAMMNDPDVALAMGQVSLGSDNGHEWGFAAVKSGGDYTTTQVKEGSQTSVFVPNPPGAEGRFHSHGNEVVHNADGTTSYTDPNKASPTDEQNAKTTGTKGYIQAPAGLIRVVGPGHSTTIMDKKEWRALVRNVRRIARAAKKEEKARNREARQKKDH